MDKIEAYKNKIIDLVKKSKSIKTLSITYKVLQTGYVMEPEREQDAGKKRI